MKYDLTHTAMVGGDGIPVFLIPSATPDREINDRRKRERADILRIVNAHADLVAAAKHALRFLEARSENNPTYGQTSKGWLKAAIKKAEGVTR